MVMTAPRKMVMNGGGRKNELRMWGTNDQTSKGSRESRKLRRYAREAADQEADGQVRVAGRLLPGLE
jgi:hypothetical protein